MGVVRIILGLLAGAVVAMLVVGGVEFAGMSLFPVPPGLDLSTPEAIAANMSQIPIAAIASIAVAWTLAALTGGFIATKITRKGWATWVVAAILSAAALYNLTTIPSPIWLWVCGLLGIAAGGYFGGRLGAAAQAAN